MTFRARAALLALGIASVALPAPASAATATKHRLEIATAEQHIRLPEHATTTYSLSCPGADIATDGMWRIDDVRPYDPQLADPGEPPWTLASGVSVLAAYPSASDTYTFRFRNATPSDAQLKIFVTCLADATSADTHAHALDVTPLWTGPHDYPGAAQGAYHGLRPAACPPGSTFISPGFRVNAGDAEIFASLPSPNLREWTYGLYVKAPDTRLSTYGRCLQGLTAFVNGLPRNHRHRTYAYLLTGAVHLDRGNGVWEHQIACGEHQKGLVGGFDVFQPGFLFDQHAWSWLGMDPRTRTRAFRTLGTDAGGQYALVCLNDRTGRPLFS